MRKIYFQTVILLIASTGIFISKHSNAQGSAVPDTVIPGASYANVIYYSMPNRNVLSGPHDSWDWKPFNMTNFICEIVDSLVYFVKPGNGDVYKLYFTGFDGSTTGIISFVKEKLFSNGVGETTPHHYLSLYFRILLQKTLIC
jgi:hypothetical protein